MFEHNKIAFQPAADPAAIVRMGPYRFTVLTSKLLRMEFNPDGLFEDRPTQVVWYRELPVPAFTQSINEDSIHIETEHLLLKSSIRDSGFHPGSLQIELKDSGYIWEFGQENKANLLGTVRTLDQVDGDIPLNSGLLSRNGWSLVDDSDSLVFNDVGWLETRDRSSELKDLYFFGYGIEFTECLIDFQKLSGRVPILPRFALGNWWSRYWKYTQDELLRLMGDFRRHQVPFSVCIVDMDWHIVDTGNESSGWTGYTWNNNLFPDPQSFLNEIHDLGLRTALNLHPASGVYPHEEKYETMARRMNINPDSQEPVRFDIANPNFTKAYFEVLHHPLEALGVDFWWLDWQQGTESTMEGLDPLFWLNHIHFYDRSRDGKTRPFIFSRWGGLGSHRYPIGFSGDTFVTWDTLQFLPYFTATAANVGYGWWSHDIGGHMGGVEEPELYLRWVQYGVFSPILRLHSTNNPYHERRPWGYDAETERLSSDALRLRHSLIPYLYTAAWRNFKDGTSPIRPLYHLYPEITDAYICPNEYTFGSELIAAPFTSPSDAHTRLSRQVIWLPEGDWFDFFTGQYYEGNGWHVIYGGLDRIPVFAKAGAIVPLGPFVDWGGVDLPNILNINIFPGADNSFSLYEDDGETLDYEKGNYALTEFKQIWNNTRTEFSISPAKGEPHIIPENRIYRLVFSALEEPESINAKIDGEKTAIDWQYDKSDHKITLTDIVLPSTSELKVEILSEPGLLYSNDYKQDTLKHMLKDFRLNSYTKDKFSQELDDFMTNPMMLVNYSDRMEQSHLLALVEAWLGKQTEKISDDPEEAFHKIINMIYKQ